MAMFLLTAKVFHNNYVVWLLPWLGLWLANRLIPRAPAQ
jgi:hypothetical protein